MLHTSNFRDLFENVTNQAGRAPRPLKMRAVSAKPGSRMDTVSVGPYIHCDVGGKRILLYGKPSTLLMEFLKKNMFPVDYDTLYFEVVDRHDRERPLILARYSKIIGSRDVARVDLATIPYVPKQ